MADIEPATTLPGLVTSIAERHPDVVAVEEGTRTLTYRMLDRLSNAAARMLAAMGVRRGDRVVLQLAAGRDTFVSMLGVLKLGAAYVMVSPASPAGYVDRILTACEPRIVLTTDSGRGDIARRPLTVTDLADADDTALPDVVSPVERAYVTFTAGTTGVPKGVMIAHAAILNHTRWWIRELELGVGDRVVQRHELNFDVSAGEVWGALGAGATLLTAGPEQRTSPAAIRDLCRTPYDATVLLATPTMWSRLARQDWTGTSLKIAVAGGEPLSAGVVRDVRAATDVPLINMYGPSECAVTGLFSRLGEGDGEVPVGIPIDGVTAHILDEGLAPTPAGEIVLGGVCVGDGYIGDPAGTAAAFVPDPTAWRPGRRMYRTGDRGALVGGQVHFAGRTDRQVKHRGYRVDLAEVGTAVAEVAKLDSCTVLMINSEDDSSLVAFGTSAGAHPPSVSLHRDLAARLPHYMLPSSVRWVGELPLRDNYKLDESALPDLPYTELLAASGEAAGDPDSETARAVLACFRRVLDGTPVTVDDNFFLLGGDSVGAAEVVMHVNEQFGEVLGVADFFREPTVRYVVDQIEQRHAAV